MHAPTLPDFFQAAYYTLAVLAALVILPYGRSTFVAWRECGGRWRDVPGCILRGVLWHFVPTLRDLYAVLRGKRPGIEPPVELACDLGQFLRGFIVLSFTGYLLCASMFANLDRSAFPPVILAGNVLFVGTAIAAALGHVFLAFRHSPRAYRVVAFGTAVALSLGSCF